jgi:hypothetical protein
MTKKDDDGIYRQIIMPHARRAPQTWLFTVSSLSLDGRGRG